MINEKVRKEVKKQLGKTKEKIKEHPVISATIISLGVGLLAGYLLGKKR